MSEESGTGSCDICPCCDEWSPTEERTAADIIKQNSKYKLLGRYAKCCMCCYNRHFLRRIYTFFGVIFGLFVIILLIYGFALYEPSVYLEKFKEANCSVYSVDGNTTTECEHEVDDQKTYHKYVCIKLYVTYYAEEAHVLKERITLFFQTYRDLTSYKGCSFHPQSCETQTTEIFRKKLLYYEEEGWNATFPCFYNPDNLEEVVGEGTILHPDRARYILKILIALFVLTAAGLAIPFFICGCDFVCTSAVPPEVQDTMRGEMEMSLAQCQQPVIHAGTPVCHNTDNPSDGFTKLPSAVAPLAPLAPNAPPIDEASGFTLPPAPGPFEPPPPYQEYPQEEGGPLPLKEGAPHA